jgi:hypothetical protein
VQISDISALNIVEELGTEGEVQGRDSRMGSHKEGCGDGGSGDDDDDDILSATRDGLDPYHSLLFI